MWFANLGYGRPEIAQAVRSQMRGTLRLSHLHRYRHAPDPRPGRRIAKISPDPDSKVFFTSGGSDAVDTAAKLVRRYHALTGNPERSVIIAREWAYHGMHTYGTSLGGIEPNRSGYGDLVGDVVFVPHDDTEAVEKAIDHAGAERIAAIFCEPVIGAGGVRPVPIDYLHSVRDLVRAAGGLFISDEVITGFGRMGDWFAANRFDLDPDLILFAKGVTAGYQPLGGIIASPRVAAPFFDQAGGDLATRLHLLRSCHGLRCRAGGDADLPRGEVFDRALELEKELEAALEPARWHRARRLGAGRHRSDGRAPTRSGRCHPRPPGGQRPLASRGHHPGDGRQRSPDLSSADLHPKPGGGDGRPGSPGPPGGLALGSPAVDQERM